MTPESLTRWYTQASSNMTSKVSTKGPAFLLRTSLVTSHSLGISPPVTCKVPLFAGGSPLRVRDP